MKFRIVLLAVSALMMGACGSNDQDIKSQTAPEGSAAPAYVNSEDNGTDVTVSTPDSTITLETDTREPYEGVVEQRTVDNDLNASGAEAADTLQTPEDGMPEDTTSGSSPQ
tara:strand:- start:22 stop:354 length:333 start_codon:yes stop_codon:yes gene_type:complete